MTAAFLVVAVVVVVAPGPDFALAVQTTLGRGRRAGFATAFGIVSGQAVWAVASAAGVAALLVASHPAFVALRVAGAVYLVWLGVQGLLAAWRGDVLRVSRRRGPAYRQGFLSNLGNPKMAVFFTSLLPQFGARLGELLVHAATLSLLTFAWLAIVVLAGSTLRVPAVRRAIDALTGIVLVAFGIGLATERR